MYVRYDPCSVSACSANLPDTVYWINRDYKICIVRFYPCCDKLSDPGTDIGHMGYLHVDTAYLPEFYIVSACFTAMALWRHKANIKRLLTGTENKFGMKKNQEE